MFTSYILRGSTGSMWVSTWYWQSCRGSPCIAGRSGIAEVVLIKFRNIVKKFSSVLIIIMNIHVYILYSKKLNRFYVGQTTNLGNRLSEHNQGESNYTSQGLPWTLLWSVSKSSLNEALTFERKLKNLSRARKMKFMIKYDEGVHNAKLLKYLVTKKESEWNAISIRMNENKILNEVKVYIIVEVLPFLGSPKANPPACLPAGLPPYWRKKERSLEISFFCQQGWPRK